MVGVGVRVGVRVSVAGHHIRDALLSTAARVKFVIGIIRCENTLCFT